MPTLVEQIEAYLKDLIKRAPSGSIELRRADLALLMGCAPSQINYTLSTRFTPQRGYIVETRRGGGGYLRISRLTMEYNQLLVYFQECSTEQSLQNFVERLFEEEFLSKREFILIQAMLSPEVDLAERQREMLNAQILKVLALLLREG